MKIDSLLGINSLAFFHFIMKHIGTSVPSERVFSTAGNVITKKRSSLAPSTAANLIFLRPEAIVHILNPITCKTVTSPWKRIGDVFGISVTDYYSKNIILNDFQPIHSSFTFSAEELGEILKQ